MGESVRDARQAARQVRMEPADDAAAPALGFAIDPSQPITAQVYGQLRRVILTGRLAPGTALSENELSAQFGISRTPCREALIRLAEDGLVTIYAQRGTVVAPIDADGVAQAQFIREALEVAVVGELAGRAERPDLDGARALLREQARAAAKHAHDRFFELDEAFHRELCALAGRAPVWPVIAGVKTQLDRVRFLSLPDPRRIADILEQHGHIINAVDGGNVAGARRAMRTHLRAVLTTIATLEPSRPPAALPIRRRG